MRWRRPPAVDVGSCSGYCRLALLAVIAVGVALRIGVTLTLDAVADGPDATSYLRMAETLATTGRMRDLFGNVAFYNAGYALFLAPFFRLLGAVPESAQLPSVLLGGLSIWLTFLCAREVLSDWRWALVPALFWATYPPALMYTEYASKENLMIPLMLLGSWLLLRYPRARRKGLAALVLGVVLGATLLTAAATLPLGVLYLWVVLANPDSDRPLRQRLLRIAALGLGLALSLGPWLLHTNHHLGSPVVTSSGGFNLYLGNNPNQGSGLFMSISDTPIGSSGWNALRDELGELGASRRLGEEAVAHVLGHPLQALALGLKKLYLFWYPPVHAGQGSNTSGLEAAVRLAWLIYYVPAVLLALAGMFVVDRSDPRALTLYGAICLYWAVHGIVYVIFRYRLPIMPLVVVAATWCVAILSARVRSATARATA